MDEYPWKVKAARKAKNLTQKQLAEVTGVPLSAITKMNINNQDALLNCVAICRVLDLSVDELFGLKSAGNDAERAEKIHSLELENTRLAGDVRCTAEVEKLKNSIIYALVGMCTLLVLVVIGYMVFDAHVLNAGLFQSARMSVFAVLLSMVLLGAIGAIIYAMRTVRKK